MKKIIFLSILIPSIVFSQWVQQSVPLGINMVLSIDFANVNTGAASGWGQMFFGSAVYTTNSGTNWYLAQVPDSSRSLVKVQMIDANTGYIAGAYNIFKEKSRSADKSKFNYIFRNYYERIGLTGAPDDYRGLFLKTTNGGRNWFTLDHLPSNVYYLMGMKFININTGFVAASLDISPNGSNAVLKTTNGGVNWINLYSLDSSDINSVFTLDGNSVFVTGWKISNQGPDGVILRSSNGGSAWNMSVFPGIGFFYDVNFPNTSTGFAVTYDTVTNALIYKTTNTGLNWTKLGFQYPFSVFYSVEFVNGTGKGLITGAKGRVPSGFSDLIFCRTTDYGSSWTSFLIPDTIHLLHGSSLADANNWFVCGGSIEGPIIYKSTNGGAIGIKPISSEIPAQFSLSQNYPNPFNPSTKIKFDIPPLKGARGMITTAAIYDALGREITVLVNEQLSPGTYEVEWDGSNYPSGVYFYKLTAGDYSETKKMVLVK